MKIQSTYYVESSMYSQNQSLYVATEDWWLGAEIKHFVGDIAPFAG